jgi:polyphenol oxidase
MPTLELLKAKRLEAHGLTHAFTTRHGGLSNPPYESFNLAFHVGDDPLHVRQNQQLLSDALGYDLERLVYMRQIHSNIVHIVNENDRFNHPPECDALITNQKNTPLMIMSADCIPIILYDPIQHVIAVVHAGRAGAFLNIIQTCIHTMQSAFTCNVTDIIAVLGPSIHGCCYEINQDIASEAKRLGYADMITRKACGIYLHVNHIVTKQLQDIGVNEACIEELSYCTSCHNERFFSYRADKHTTGRIAAIALLQ